MARPKKKTKRVLCTFWAESAEEKADMVKKAKREGMTLSAKCTEWHRKNKGKRIATPKEEYLGGIFGELQSIRRNLEELKKSPYNIPMDIDKQIYAQLSRIAKASHEH